MRRAVDSVRLLGFLARRKPLPAGLKTTRVEPFPFETPPYAIPAFVEPDGEKVRVVGRVVVLSRNDRA
jgi:hypothetical protein